MSFLSITPFSRSRLAHTLQAQIIPCFVRPPTFQSIRRHTLYTVAPFAERLSQLHRPFPLRPLTHLLSHRLQFLQPQLHIFFVMMRISHVTRDWAHALVPSPARLLAQAPVPSLQILTAFPHRRRDCTSAPSQVVTFKVIIPPVAVA